MHQAHAGGRHNLCSGKGAPKASFIALQFLQLDSIGGDRRSLDERAEVFQLHWDRSRTGRMAPTWESIWTGKSTDDVGKPKTGQSSNLLGNPADPHPGEDDYSFTDTSDPDVWLRATRSAAEESKRQNETGG